MAICHNIRRIHTHNIIAAIYTRVQISTMYIPSLQHWGWELRLGLLEKGVSVSAHDKKDETMLVHQNGYSRNLVKIAEVNPPRDSEHTVAISFGSKELAISITAVSIRGVWSVCSAGSRATCTCNLWSPWNICMYKSSFWWRYVEWKQWIKQCFERVHVLIPCHNYLHQTGISDSTLQGQNRSQITKFQFLKHCRKWRMYSSPCIIALATALKLCQQCWQLT